MREIHSSQNGTVRKKNFNSSVMIEETKMNFYDPSKFHQN